MGRGLFPRVAPAEGLSPSPDPNLTVRSGVWPGWQAGSAKSAPAALEWQDRQPKGEGKERWAGQRAGGGGVGGVG